ncbi:DUF1471 domain-containing protein [Shewanella surugensis]|uniref:DUF1471 domain-containing protein n=1 Tax=Shewanella surugensis TaxID=212020 RepID=A0ABT0LEV2_9GAMM|nr:DUF1471 domain-containing protein [Shewanella surugensis]MCL1126226.1 DUF1471 domain-containing protein [Shewanella surugensis]
MRNIIITSLLALAVTGCVTKKVPIMPEANSVTAITAANAAENKCEFIKTDTLTTKHPNNVARELKNKTYVAGGNRYLIAEVLERKKGRPTSVKAVFFRCPVAYNYKVKPAGNVQLLPGANSVKPIAFSEIENNNCKILTTHMIDKTSPDSLEVELSNETYMQGGNRFHITKIVDANHGRPTSVVADIYRCQHRTVAFEQ